MKTTETLALNQISAALTEWNNARNSNGLQQMLDWLNQGNMFYFQPDMTNQPVPGQNKAYVHVYPGVMNGMLKFFVISAYYDRAEFASTIEEHIQVCNIAEATPGSNNSLVMPTELALSRIDNWDVHHNHWIAENISTEDSIFQAFCVPQSDTITSIQNSAFLALKGDQNGPEDFSAELIIEGSENLFFDTVAPVPPFLESGHLSEESFYLLDLIS